MNPVRAGIVKHPGEYRCTSYSTNGLGEQFGPISPHSLYRQLGRTDFERQEAYRELFHYELEQGEINNIRKATNGNFALGNERFTKEISNMLGRRVGDPITFKTWSVPNIAQTLGNEYRSDARECRTNHINALRSADRHDLSELLEFVRT